MIGSQCCRCVASVSVSVAYSGRVSHQQLQHLFIVTNRLDSMTAEESKLVRTKQAKTSERHGGRIYLSTSPCLSSNYYSPSTMAKITRANKRLGCMALHQSVQLLIHPNPKRRFSPTHGVIASATCCSVCAIICYLFIALPSMDTLSAQLSPAHGLPRQPHDMIHRRQS